VTAPALRVEGLTVAYRNGAAWHEAIREVDLTIEPGASVGLVGESGSGKTTLALAVMRYLGGTGRVTHGRIELAGRDLLALNERDLRTVRRERVRLVPQDPLASLNPSLTIGRQVAEGLARHPLAAEGRPRRRASQRERVDALLTSVGLADTERVAASYPHQLSGGMQQRVAIAMALGGEPELLVMDEPTTNLDVTTEATILDLVRDLVRDRGTAVLYVSHSLGVVATLCDRVAVLYAGELVEAADVAAAYARPFHPYTLGLLASLPRVGQDRHREPLRPIAGRLPEPGARPSGCVFAPRCPVALDDLCAVRPALDDAEAGRRVRCHRWSEIATGTLDARPRAGAGARVAGAKAGVAIAPPATATPLTPDVASTPLTPAAADAPVAPDAGSAPAAADAPPPVLAIQALAKRFPVRRGPVEALLGRPTRAVRALAGATLEVRRTRTLGLVGESGSGKSTLARCVVGLIEPSSGVVELLGVPLARRLERRDTETLRSLQMVFQNSGDALNPYLTVGETLRRPLRRLARLPRAEASTEARRLLEAVNLPAGYAERTPAELSGGEQQRVAIARAFASQPDLVVFDESVSGLDVSIQAALLELVTRLQAERSSAYLFISHDLAVVSYLADDVAVIYLGVVMELGSTASVLRPPYHPYTEALLSAVPIPDPDLRRDRVRLRGEAPSPVDLPGGCPFHTRCPRFLGDVCVTEAPPWRHDAAADKGVACHIPLETLREVQRPMFADAPADPPLVEAS
jgi:peptide/nickel transport system ATP-binding protein